MTTNLFCTYCGTTQPHGPNEHRPTYWEGDPPMDNITDSMATDVMAYDLREGEVFLMGDGLVMEVMSTYADLHMKGWIVVYGMVTGLMVTSHDGEPQTGFYVSGTGSYYVKANEMVENVYHVRF